MSIANGEWVEKMQHEKDEDPALSYELKKDEKKLFLMDSKDILPGLLF